MSTGGQRGPREPRERQDTPGRQSDLLYRSVIAAMSEGVVIQDAGGAILACNDSALRILGLTEDQIMGRTSLDPRWSCVREDGSIFPGEQHPAMETLRTGRAIQGAIMGVHKPSGELSWISINTQPLFRDKADKPYQVVVTFLDITSRRRVEEQLLNLARTDSLTGLANRAHFLDELARSIARSDRHHRTFVLAYVDLDGFKPINDQHGHELGDRLLKQVGERLRGCLRRSDFLARLGGDEFVALVEEVEPANATLVAEKILGILGRPFRVDPHELRIGASIGLALYPGAGKTPEELLRAADGAMYAAKRAGRGRFSMA